MLQIQTYFLQAYQNVVKLAPQHFEARRALSNILNKLGRPEEALHTLTQDEKAELLNPSLLVKFTTCFHEFSEYQFTNFFHQILPDICFDFIKCSRLRKTCLFWPISTDNSLPGCLGIIGTCTCTLLLYFCCNKRQIWLFFKEIVSL